MNGLGVILTVLFSVCSLFFAVAGWFTVRNLILDARHIGKEFVSLGVVLAACCVCEFVFMVCVVVAICFRMLPT